MKLVKVISITALMSVSAASSAWWGNGWDRNDGYGLAMALVMATDMDTATAVAMAQVIQEAVVTVVPTVTAIWMATLMANST